MWPARWIERWENEALQKLKWRLNIFNCYDLHRSKRGGSPSPGQWPACVLAASNFALRILTSIYIYTYVPGPANGQKKNVVLVNDPVFSQLTYFGSDRAIQPKRPKMAEIWLKSKNVFAWCSNPITSLSFTIATLVALIDPWRVWLDPWGLRFQAWASALLFHLFFAELVHCSGIGCQLA